jgi:hypothetical protein
MIFPTKLRTPLPQTRWVMRCGETSGDRCRPIRGVHCIIGGCGCAAFVFPTIQVRTSWRGRRFTAAAVAKNQSYADADGGKCHHAKEHFIWLHGPLPNERYDLHSVTFECRGRCRGERRFFEAQRSSWGRQLTRFRPMQP